MALFHKFNAFVQKENLFKEQDALLLAVSGGVDSVVLCALCEAGGYQFSIAHCNFQLRGEESDRDEEFVKTLAEKFNVPFYCKKFDTETVSRERKTGIEETARKLRYDWFSEIMSTEGYPYLLTAHHADDNIETVLMNFFRGTGIKGLRGILPKQEQIIRPLLFATKKEIESYAAQNNISFTADSTNAENNYTRNFFRNELIPSIEKVYQKVKENISDNITRFTDIESLYNDSISNIKNKLLEKKGDEMHIPALKLAKIKPLHTVIHEIIKDFGFTAAQVSEAEKLLTADSGKYILSATHRILKNRNWLIIAPIKASEDTSLYIIEKDTNAVSFPGGKLKISRDEKPGEISVDTNTACIEEDLLTYPLLLRRPKQGDYFYPLGMQKKKKLSRFFADIKLSLLQKEKVWVLESDRKIVWVAGYRLDDRFKIRPQTKNMIRLSFA